MDILNKVYHKALVSGKSELPVYDIYSLPRDKAAVMISGKIQLREMIIREGSIVAIMSDRIKSLTVALESMDCELVSVLYTPTARFIVPNKYKEVFEFHHFGTENLNGRCMFVLFEDIVRHHNLDFNFNLNMNSNTRYNITHLTLYTLEDWNVELDIKGLHKTYSINSLGEIVYEVKITNSTNLLKVICNNLLPLPELMSLCTGHTAELIEGAYCSNNLMSPLGLENSGFNFISLDRNIKDLRIKVFSELGKLNPNIFKYFSTDYSLTRFLVAMIGDVELNTIITTSDHVNLVVRWLSTVLTRQEPNARYPELQEIVKKKNNNNMLSVTAPLAINVVTSYDYYYDEECIHHECDCGADTLCQCDCYFEECECYCMCEGCVRYRDKLEQREVKEPVVKRNIEDNTNNNIFNLLINEMDKGEDGSVMLFDDIISVNEIPYDVPFMLVTDTKVPIFISEVVHSIQNDEDEFFERDLRLILNPPANMQYLVKAGSVLMKTSKSMHDYLQRNNNSNQFKFEATNTGILCISLGVTNNSESISVYKDLKYVENANFILPYIRGKGAVKLADVVVENTSFRALGVKDTSYTVTELQSLGLLTL